MWASPSIVSATPAATALASPVVTDGRVTFNLRAPEAKSVTVSGDFGPDTAMTRGPHRIDDEWTRSLVRSVLHGTAPEA